MKNVTEHGPRSRLAAAGVLVMVLAAGSAVASGPSGEASAERAPPAVTVFATGLNNPRGLTFGPDGALYVAEAGSGGSMTATDTSDCPAIVNIFSPFQAGYTGRVVRVLANGTTQTVADNLPSVTDATGASLGPTDVAFVGDTLYVLIEMGGCSHGLPDDLPAILKVHADGSTSIVADLNAWHRDNPPHYIKDTDPATTDQEPGGVFHSMIAVGKHLYLVETNRGFLLRVDPATGVIEKLYDLTIDEREHNPIVLTRRGNKFHLGTFGEDGGPAELAEFDKDFERYWLPFESLNPIVGLAWHGALLYGVEIFPLDDPWSPDTANLVTFDPRTGARTEVLTGFASFPNGLVRGPDGALYTSNQATSFAPDDGSILRIVP